MCQRPTDIFSFVVFRTMFIAKFMPNYFWTVTGIKDGTSLRKSLSTKRPIYTDFLGVFCFRAPAGSHHTRDGTPWKCNGVQYFLFFRVVGVSRATTPRHTSKGCFYVCCECFR